MNKVDKCLRCISVKGIILLWVEGSKIFTRKLVDY